MNLHILEYAKRVISTSQQSKRDDISGTHFFYLSTQNPNREQCSGYDIIIDIYLRYLYQLFPVNRQLSAQYSSN